MNNLWHPVIVHLPLGLSILMPLLLLLMAVLQGKGKLDRPVWLIPLLVQALIVTGAFLALKTGGAEEELVERGIQKAAIHLHEEAAEVFTWTATGLLALTLLPLLPFGDRPRRAISFVLLGISLVTLALALRTGKAGGALVYEHQAPAIRAGLELSTTPVVNGTPGSGGEVDED